MQVRMPFRRATALVTVEREGVLEAMMGRRGYGVETATAQMQVFGKRHYGLKALPQGGGRGRQTTRELFDTLLHWKGRVPLDARGEDSVEVPLNDSLTCFRIVAVATGSVGLFGTGSTTIRSTQELMILAGIAPLIREGDRFRSELTLRNTTNRTMDVIVKGQVNQLVARSSNLKTRSEEEPKAQGSKLEATPSYELRAMSPSWPLAPQAIRLSPGQAGVVGWKIPAELQQRMTEGLQKFVEGAILRRSSLPTADLSIRKLAALEALSRYRQADPNRHGKPESAAPENGHREFLGISTANNHDQPGLVAPVNENVLQNDSGFSKANRHGHAELATAGNENESRRNSGVFLVKLLGSLTIEPNLWPTSALLDWRNLLQRVREIPGREKRLHEAEQIVRSWLNLQGTTMGFSTERSDELWWLMVSPEANAVCLILHLLEAGQWREDLPRLLRGALTRQRRGSWDLTVANAWGALAVEKFSRAFEATPVTGMTTVSLAGGAQRIEWVQAPKGKTLAFPWPERREDLIFEHAGAGHPWFTLQAQAAIPLKAPLSSGYRITKTLTPIERRAPGRWSRGDLVRVRLAVEAQGDMTWVVVSDPIPAGASHLGAGLARGSRIATRGEEQKGEAWPAFEERAFEAFRAYYEYVPKGRFIVEYTIRLNQGGRFQLPQTRVGALYAPEMFGELPNAPLEVQP